MLQFLLDTDHLTLFQHKHAALMQRISLQPAGSLGVCPVNIEETMRGRLALLGRALAGNLHIQAYAHLVAAIDLFKYFPCVPFDLACEARYQQLRAARLHIGTLDLKIAAIALTNNLTVLTRNLKDFGRVSGLLLEDWSA